jgi:outer membrane protein, heavy metal efflux system
MRTSVFATVLAAALAAGRLEGQPAPAPAAEDAFLSALVAEALAHNPDVLAARQALEAARARPDQARSLRDPMFSVVYTNDGSAPSLGREPMTTLGFMGSQEIPIGKRGLRGDILGREADETEQALERAKRSLGARVRRSYYELAATRGLLALIREQEDVWKETEGVARARYAVGQGAQQDVLRVQVEITRIEQLRTEQQLEVEVRTTEINRLLGRAPEVPVETPVPLVLQPEPRALAELLSWSADVSPELKAAAARIEGSRLAVELAHKDFRPDLTVQGGYMNRGGLPLMWQAGVGVNLPVYRGRLQSGLAEAEARLRESEQLRESLRQRLDAATRTRLSRIRAAERLAVLYEQGVVPQDQMSVASAIASYRAGKVPFVSVLEALGTLYLDRSSHLRLLAAHLSARASLDEASLDAGPDLPSMGSFAMPAGAATISAAMKGQ